jgi:hypothetical protein
MPEGRDHRTTRRHSVVGEPPAQDLGKPSALPFDPVVAHRLQASLDLPQLSAQALSTRLPPENEVAAIPTVRAVVREPKEVERLRFAETPSAPVRNRGPAELDEPRLVRLKGESEPREPCVEITKELLCLRQPLADQSYDPTIANPVLDKTAGIGLSVFGMIGAAFGYITPVQATLFQELIDVAVIVNALRALENHSAWLRTLSWLKRSSHSDLIVLMVAMAASVSDW